MEKLGSGIQEIRLFQLFMSLASASKMITEIVDHSISELSFVVSNPKPQTPTPTQPQP